MLNELYTCMYIQSLFHLLLPLKQGGSSPFPSVHRQAKVVFEYTPVGTDVVMNREEFDGEAKTLTYVSFMYMNYQGFLCIANPRLCIPISGCMLYMYIT